MAGAGSAIFGLFLAALGWAGFDLLGSLVVQRRDLGYDIVPGDAGVLAVLAGLGLASTLVFAWGVARLRSAGTARALPSQDEQDDAEWRRRRLLFGAPVRTGVVVLAYIFFGGPALFFIGVAVWKPSPELAVAGVVVGGLLLFIVGGLTYWLLRRRRYGDSACWLRTLPGVAGGRFEADVECALPQDPDPGVIVRLKNLVPAGKSIREVWRMEERIAVPARPGRTVLEVRLAVPRAKEQVFMPLKRGLKEWLLGGGFWILEIEKQVPGIDFHASFPVQMTDQAAAAPAPVPAPPGFGVQPHEAAPRASPGEAGVAFGVALAFCVAWVGYKDKAAMPPDEPVADWRPQVRFDRDFKTWRAKGYYPHAMEGRCQDGEEQYRGDWRPIPQNGRFWAWHRMLPAEYESRNRGYIRDGYTQQSIGRFRDCGGIERVSATWLKSP